MIYLISGEGIRAGKTTLAKRLTPHVYSLAEGIRQALALEYPDYPWFSRKQADKDLIVTETGFTVREMMVAHGQNKCADDKAYWARELAKELREHACFGQHVAIDDVRKVVERDYFKRLYGNLALHIHVQWAGAIYEPQYDNKELAETADYIVVRRS